MLQNFKIYIKYMKRVLSKPLSTFCLCMQNYANWVSPSSSLNSRLTTWVMYDVDKTTVAAAAMED